MVALLDARLSTIPPGVNHLQAIIENSHRKDDECFLSIHPKRCKDSYGFLHNAKAMAGYLEYCPPFVQNRHTR